MYTIKYGNKILNDYFSNDDLLVYNVTLSQNKNEFAYLDFEMAYTHPLYKEMIPNDINNPIILCDDGEPIFIGYIYEIETDFELNLSIKCKDVMSFLSQSLVKPYFTSDQDPEPIHPWPKPPDPPVQYLSLAIDPPPDKLIYWVDEKFDPTGLRVWLVDQTGGRTETWQYRLSDPDMSTEGEKVVVVTYQPNPSLTGSFVITVNSQPTDYFDKLELDPPPSKTHYLIGETLVLTGMKVKAHYAEQGTWEWLDSSQYEVGPFDSSTEGEKTISVTCLLPRQPATSFKVTVSKTEIHDTIWNEMISDSATWNYWTDRAVNWSDELEREGPAPYDKQIQNDKKPLTDQKDVWPLGLTRVSNLPREYFKFLLYCHNSMAQPQQMILPGHIELPNDRITVSIKNIQYPTVFDEITDKLLNVFGGFLKMRYEGGTYYLDYLQETFDDPNLLLDFGESILDITRTKNSEELKTYIIPLGATLKDCYDEATGMYDYVDGYFITADSTPKQDKTYYTKGEKKHDYSEWEWKSYFDKNEDGRPIVYYEHDDDTDESEVPLTIDRYPLVNDIEVYSKKIYKKGNRLFDKSMASKYGMIGYIEQNTNIKNIQDLILWGAQSLIEKTTIAENISIKAVDLKLINNKPITIGDHVRIRSTMHDVDKFFECIEININISSPENTTYQFGSRLDTLTNSVNTNSDYLDSKINKYWDKR